MAVPVLLLGRDRRVVFANAAAERLLASSASPLTTIKGLLVSRDSRSNRALQKAITEIVAGKPNSGAEVKIDRAQGRPLFATLIPFAGENRFFQERESVVCCAVIIVDPNSIQMSRTKAIARRYKLTPAEAHLLDSILSGTGLAQAAEQIGVSPTTARTHLQRIFAKTGARRQAELVNLVMTSTLPLTPRDR